MGHGRQALSRLPVGVFGPEPGPLSSQDPRGDGRAGEAPHADIPRLPQRPAGPALRGPGEAHGLPQDPADEQRGGGGRIGHQGRAQVGLRSEGRRRGPGRDHRLLEQFSWPHAGHRRLQHRSGCARRLRPVRAGLSRRAVRRLRRLRLRGQREHGRVPGRADPGRGRRHHPAGRLFHPRAGALQRTQRDADPRRDPDRPRAHRQAPGGGARRDRSGRDADRQGAFGRLLSGLGGAFELRSARRARSPASTAAPSAAIRSPARWRAWR